MRAILQAFRVPTQSTLKTFKEANEQASKCTPSDIPIITWFPYFIVQYRSPSPSFRAESQRHRGPDRSSSGGLGPTWFGQGDGRENPEVLQGGTRKDMGCQAPGRVF